MTHFWKWLGASVSGAALAYGGLIGLSGLALPWRPTHFDTHVVNTTERGWVNEARYFVLNKRRLGEDGNRIVLLGASNNRDPFRPKIMEQGLPGWTVANASLSGASIGELGDAVDLIYLDRSADAQGRTVFVLGLNYLQFLPSPYVKGRDNPLATEAKRGGLHVRHDGVLEERYPEAIEQGLEAVFRPQAVAASMPRRAFSAVFVNPDLPAVKGLVDRFRGDDPLSRWTEFIGEQRDLNTVTVPDDIRAALLAQRLAGAGGDKPLPPEGFEQLAELVARIRARGDAVVIVELPLPDWHSDGVPLAEASFRDGVSTVVARSAGDRDVALVSLREFDGDDNFFDSAHPKPRMWPAFSRRLAAELAASGVLRTPASSDGSMAGEEACRFAAR